MSSEDVVKSLSFEKRDDGWSKAKVTHDVWPIMRDLYQPTTLLISNVYHSKKYRPWARRVDSTAKLHEFGILEAAEYNLYPQGLSWVLTSAEFDKARAVSGMWIENWIDFPAPLKAEILDKICLRHFKDESGEADIGTAIAQEGGGKFSCFYDGMVSELDYADDATGITLLDSMLGSFLRDSVAREVPPISHEFLKTLMTELLSIRGEFALWSKDVLVTDTGFQIQLKGKKHIVLVELRSNDAKFSVVQRRRRLWGR